MRFFPSKRLCLPLFLAVAAPFVHAAEIPPGGTPVNPEGRLRTFVEAAQGSASIEADGTAAVRIAQPAIGRAYTAQIAATCESNVAAGQPLLIVVTARATRQSGLGATVLKLQMASAPYSPLAPTTEVEIPGTWTGLPVLMVPAKDIAAGQGVLMLQCGHLEQAVEVKSIRIVAYPAGTPTVGFPRVRRTYPGREPEAAWRKEARQRIERNRKADLTLSLTRPDDAPLSHAEVRLTLRRHQFGFGSAVTTKRLTGTSSDDLEYRKVVDRLFSIVVFENDLKDGYWDPGRPAGLKRSRNLAMDESFRWLQERHIGVRGHYLMQVATPYNLANERDGAVIREKSLSSVRERLEFVRDRVCEWDVINHPIAWAGADMLNKRPGLEHLDRDVFKLARSMTKLPFFVNEDQVFRSGPQHDDTYTYIETLNRDGLTVDGLGNQAHIDESHLPTPEHILAVTDRFARIVPRQSITEYDITTNHDEDLAADYTRDILIATFSHPAYTSFLLWGFWEGEHWKPAASSWNKDWSAKKRGMVLDEWIGRTWRTDLTLKTDAQGRLSWRGFPGWYDVTVNGRTQSYEVTAGQP